MSRWPCFICGEETYEMYYVEVNNFTRGANPWTCAKHVAELITRWQQLFPGTGNSHTEGDGLMLSWDQLKAIEDRFERDSDLRLWQYQVTDREVRVGHFDEATRSHA